MKMKLVTTITVMLLLASVTTFVYASPLIWKTIDWGTAGYGSIALSAGDLAVTTAAFDGSSWGTAHYNTPSGFRAAAAPWVKFSFIDAPGTAAGQLWMEDETYDANYGLNTGTLGAWTQFGAWERNDRPNYMIYWWDYDTALDGFVDTGVARTAGAHTLLLGMRQDGTIDYWLDGSLVLSTTDITPNYFGDIYLAAHSPGANPAQTIIFTDYQTGTDYFFGYTLEHSGTGFSELSCAQSRSSNLAVKMGTIVGSDKAAIMFEGGPTLSTINSLSYWTDTVQAGTFNQLTAWIAIYLHTQSGKTYNDWVTDYLDGSSNVYYIQAEPYYTYSDHTGSPDIVPTMNTWVKWDAFDLAMPLEWESLESTGSPHGAPTLAQYIAGPSIPNYSTREYGGLYVCAIKIRMGYGGPWVNTLAYVDDVTINNYFEDFGAWNLHFDTSSTSIVQISNPATLKVHLTDQDDNPVQGQTITFSGNPAGLAFTNVINPTDSTGLAQVTATTATANVYTVTATVCGAISDTWTLVFYEPGGMAAGGGWYSATDEVTSSSGIANFGFVAKYIKGRSTGNLEFRYHAEEGFNLKSVTIDYLVITGGKIAQFGGTATKDGQSGFYFRAKAIDNGEPGVLKDEFWIKIWEGDEIAAETTDPIYSSYNTLAGGNIMVKTK